MACGTFTEGHEKFLVKGDALNHALIPRQAGRRHLNALLKGILAVSGHIQLYILVLQGQGVNGSYLISGYTVGFNARAEATSRRTLGDMVDVSTTLLT
jgi:hypothetical protein